MKNSIVIITSGQPSANPRVVKEAIALHNAGYKVVVVYSPISLWATKFDQALFQEHPGIAWVKAGWDKEQNKLGYNFARVRKKFYEKLYKRYPSNTLYAVRSHVLFSQELEKKALLQPADLYIAHNIGALPAVVKVSKVNKALAGFDAEDYHRGEDVEGSAHWHKISAIEDAFIPTLDYVSAASPCILHKYKQHYQVPFLFYIPNVAGTIATGNNDQPLQTNSLRLIWFSQSLGKQRGIETAIEAMGRLPGYNIQLFLIGNAGEDFKNEFLQIAKSLNVDTGKIYFVPVVSPADLVQYASQFDIGLAMESSWCQSRDLCETNKLFVYVSAGLATIYSDTQGQIGFLKSNGEIGIAYRQNDAESLSEALKSYMEDKGLLERHKSNAARLAKEKYNMEAFEKDFISDIQVVLQREVSKN